MRGFLGRWINRGVLGRGNREARFVTAMLGDVGADVLVVLFSRPIESPGDDFLGGVTVEKNGAGQPVTDATLQGDGRTLHYTLASPAFAGEDLTWAYDAGGGDWITTATGAAVASVTTRAVTNTLLPSQSRYGGFLLTLQKPAPD